jgi:hypothetical protein
MTKEQVKIILNQEALITGILLCIIISALIVTGCVRHQVETGPERQYPPSRYLTATGIGQSESEARNQAVSELSRIFESRIFSETFDRVTSRIDESGSEVSKQSIESNIRIVSLMELKGVRVEETWFDENEGMYYALAVLDRYQARKDWLKQLDEMDNRIEGEFGVLEAADSEYERYRSLKTILGLWIEREALVSRLNVLGFGDKRSVAYDMKSVFTTIPKARNALLMFIEITGENDSAIKNSIAAVLSGAGFTVSDNRNGSNVMIAGNVEVVPVDLKNPDWKFARATVTISVVDLRTGFSVGKIVERKRAGHLTYDEAVTKAIKLVSEPVSEKLLQYFEG